MGLPTLSTGAFYVEAGGDVSTCLTILLKAATTSTPLSMRQILPLPRRRRLCWASLHCHY